jgi:hypothetical protein
MNPETAMNQEAPSAVDAARRSLGFLTGEEVLRLAQSGAVMPEPRSVLVSANVDLSQGVTLWPTTILQALGTGRITIGAGTILFPGTRIVATDGEVRIGVDAEIGEEGGFTIKAGTGTFIEIGDGARLLGGGSLSGPNRIGRGAQILGPIRCQDCRLGDGGTYRDQEPDMRGGVLKGSGVARNIEIPQGHVIQAFGLFAEGTLRRQSYFHPRKA